MYKRSFTFDVNNRIDVFILVLAHRNHKKYGIIQNCKNVRFKDSLQPGHELSFQVYRELVSDGKKVLCGVWDDIRDFRYVYVPELEEYFEITVNIEDSGEAVKSITAINAAVPELTNVRLRSIEINTENDILRKDYELPTVFYNPDHPEASLLHRIFEKAKHYSIRHVDSSLAGIQKTFAISDTNLYDFCTATLSGEIGCLFVLDSVDRSVSVYDLFNRCSDCGHRGEFDQVCPQCGSQNVITPLGENTGIFISRENLAESIALTPNTEQIKNCLYVRGGDDLITATAANCSPSGSHIYQFSQDMLSDMSPALAGKLQDYQKQYDLLAPEYQSVMSQIYEQIDAELYLTSVMMPDLSHSPISAAARLALLTPENLSPIAVEDVSRVSLATANSAISAMATVTVGRDCKVEILSSSLSSQTWTGSFRVTSRHDKEDTADGPVIRLTITDDYQQYVQQKIDRMFHKEEAEGLSDLLTIEDLALFTAELKKYCKNRLDSFLDAFQACLDILVEKGCADPKQYPDLHTNLYLPYYRRRQAISAELAVRTGQIDAVQKARHALEQQKTAMQEQLDLEHFLGAEAYAEFLAHLIADEYVNDNYISDGLNNAQLFERAQELLQTAQAELMRSLTKSYAISASLEDLLKIQEFRPLLNRFQCGNWFVCQVDDALYRMRLLSYEITFDESSGHILTVEFSNASKPAGPQETAKDILSGAQSMAQSFSYVARQASKGNQADTVFQDFRKNGLDSSLFRIKNADTEDVLIDRHGITCRSYDDILGDYQPEQAAFIHNSLVFTTDNWKTAKCALGRLTYSFDGKEYSDYGFNTDAVISGLIIGGDIYSANYSSADHAGTHICLTDGTFSFAGDKLTYDGSSLAVRGRILSSTGKIGCWEINDTSIYKSNPGFGNQGGMYFGEDGLSLGSAFKVNPSGSTTVSDLNVTGGSIKIGDNFSVDTNGSVTAKHISLHNGSIYLGNNNTEGYFRSDNQVIILETGEEGSISFRAFREISNDCRGYHVNCNYLSMIKTRRNGAKRTLLAEDELYSDSDILYSDYYLKAKGYHGQGFCTTSYGHTCELYWTGSTLDVYIDSTRVGKVTLS